MINKNYLPQKTQLLKDFDKAIAHSRQMLISLFGQEQGSSIIREAHQEYETLIPKIPYIGDKNPLLIFLIPTSRYLAIYRVLQRYGWTVHDVGQLIHEINKAELKAIPKVVRWVIGYFWFTQWFMARLKKRAVESSKRTYPGGYVLTYVEGKGQDFDFGIDYTECASCKFLGTQNALELAPYICALDKKVSEMMGWGLTRTMTIAEGSERCDFRFKKGGKTQVAVPESIK